MADVYPIPLLQLPGGMLQIPCRKTRERSPDSKELLEQAKTLPTAHHGEGYFMVLFHCGVIMTSQSMKAAASTPRQPSIRAHQKQ